MRRLQATLLVLLVSLPLIGPLLARPAVDSSLPACCRRDGSHRCSMNRRASERGPASGWHAAAKVCPAYPQGEQAPPATGASALEAPAAIALPVPVGGESAGTAPSVSPLGRDRHTAAGRGPPAAAL